MSYNVNPQVPREQAFILDARVVLKTSDLGKYKLSSDYWENWPLVYDLDFVKDV